MSDVKYRAQWEPTVLRIAPAPPPSEPGEYYVVTAYAPVDGPPRRMGATIVNSERAATSFIARMQKQNSHIRYTVQLMTLCPPMLDTRCT
jgi:hypothetical protein